MNGGKKPKKGGATTAFDTASLGLDGRAGAKAAGKSKPKRGKVAPSRSTKPKTGNQRGREQRRAAERRKKFARLNANKPANAASKTANAAKARPDLNVVLPLAVEIRSRSASQVTLAWGSDPQVTSWKAACLLSDGTEFMKTRVAGVFDAVAIGGLNRAPQPVRFRVRGHDQVGRLVREGFVEDVRAT